MVMKKDLYQHFRADEYDFVEKIDDFACRVEGNYAYVLTDFLNPRQIEIAKSVVGHRGLRYFVSSDYFSSEYARLIIAPDYYDCHFKDFEIVLFEVKYHSKFNQLTHSQIMGTLIHQLGIKRSVIGDIIIAPGRAQFLITKNMVDYVKANITKIANVTVSLEEMTLEQLIPISVSSQKSDILVSSLRLDKVLATVLKISRSQAVQLIKTEKVKCDYRTIVATSEKLQVGNLISVRGFGRFSILSENGLTKSGKYKLTVDKMIHK